MITLLTRKTALLATLLIITGGCATKGLTVVPRSGDAPAKTRVNAPFKRVPKEARVPPTQKPYKINGKTYYPIPSAQGFQQRGIASWYGSDFHGRKTSNGETYDMHGTTAAHKTLPMQTYLLVRNLENGREMTVRVNDRGPFHKGRIIDMTRTGASQLGFIDQGTARVEITALGEATTYRQGEQETERFKDHPDFQRGEFYVQIGSFIDHNNARRLKDRMVAAGRKSVVQEFDRGDRIFYRVQVRAGNDLSTAEQVEKQLNRSGYKDTFVVAR